MRFLRLTVAGRWGSVGGMESVNLDELFAGCLFWERHRNGDVCHDWMMLICGNNPFSCDWLAVIESNNPDAPDEELNPHA